MEELQQTWEELFKRVRSDLDAALTQLEDEREVHNALLIRCEMLQYAIVGIQERIGHPLIGPPQEQERQPRGTTNNNRPARSSESELLG